MEKKGCLALEVNINTKNEKMNLAECFYLNEMAQHRIMPFSLLL